jgi:hypothetical protein
LGKLLLRIAIEQISHYGLAAFERWPNLPDDMRQSCFEAVVPDDPLLG